MVWVYFSIVLPSKMYIIQTPFKTELQLTIFFVILAFFSMVLNSVNNIHAFYAIGMKFLPIAFLLFGLAWVYHNSALQSDRVKKKLDRGIKIIFYANLIVGCIQFFVFGKVVDELGSIPNNAHTFGFLNIFLGLLLWNSGSYRKLHRLAYLFSFLVMIVADYKLGLFVFLSSLLLSKFTLDSLYSGKIALNLIFSTILIIIIVFGFIVSVPYLPSHYRTIFLVLEAHEILNLDTVIPPSLELFKGYYQLFARVLEGTWDLLLGVGPGNYGSNVAISMNKPLAAKYISLYRSQLDQMDVVYGTLLVRNNATVSLLGEYGLIGAFVYLTVFIRLLLFPLKNELRNFRQYNKSMFFSMMVLFFFLVLELPLLSVIESGLYLSLFVLYYYHFKVFRRKLNT